MTIVQTVPPTHSLHQQTEAIRQALIEFDRKIGEEEASLVHKAVELEMQRIDSGEAKTYSWDEVKKKAGIR